jgi:uncharacterized protein (DUF2235 family)
VLPESVTEAPAIAETEKKRLAVFLDGTWNAVSDNTNVWRLKALCAPKSSDGVVQLSYYGIGVNGFFGGGFGKGLSENVTQAYEWLIDHYSSGDEVFIFGFSRGAYTARSLAGLITMHGLLKAGAPIGVKQLYERYKRQEGRTIRTLAEMKASGSLGDASTEEQWILKYSQPIPIKVVGVWDTVGSLGVPRLSIVGIGRSSFRFHHTGLRVPIENAYHALAIDEHRQDFAPTLWTVHRGPGGSLAAPRQLSSVEQRWFVGAHANVGGGYSDNLLGQIPLRWMMKKASLHGLEFKNDVDIDGDVLKANIAPSYEEFMYGVYCKVKGRHFRPIGAEPKKIGDGTYSTVNETIDASVFERWRKVPEYRPNNLVEWAKRRNVDINALNQSVRADDPTVPAPD